MELQRDVVPLNLRPGRVFLGGMTADDAESEPLVEPQRLAHASDEEGWDQPPADVCGHGFGSPASQFSTSATRGAPTSPALLTRNPLPSGLTAYAINPMRGPT